MRQLALPLPKRGGPRPGAGRPRTRSHPGLTGPGVPHLTRAAVASRYPVHVTHRVQPGVGYLRQQSRAARIESAIRETRLRYGMRVAHYSIQGNHLHLIVEVAGAPMLSRAMQALSTRIAKGLNALARRSGGVFVDRYHAHALKTPREVASAVRYVIGNYRHHAHEALPPRWQDPLSSARYLVIEPTAESTAASPRTWLLRIGWKTAPSMRRPLAHEP